MMALPSNDLVGQLAVETSIVNSERQAFDRNWEQITNSGNSVHSYVRIDLTSRYYCDDKNLDNLLEAFKYYKGTLSLSLNFQQEDFTIEKINLMVLYVNNVFKIREDLVYMVDVTLSSLNVELLINFIYEITKSRECIFTFQIFHIAIGELLFDKILQLGECIACAKITQLSLHDNKLYKLTVEQLTVFVGKILENKHLKNLSLLHNGLSDLDVEALSFFYKKITQDHLGLEQFLLWHPGERGFSIEYNDVNKMREYHLIKLEAHFEKMNFEIDKPLYPLSLTSEQYCEVFQIYLSRRQYKHMSILVVSKWMVNCRLEKEHCEILTQIINFIIKDFLNLRKVNDNPSMQLWVIHESKNSRIPYKIDDKAKLEIAQWYCEQEDYDSVTFCDLHIQNKMDLLFAFCGKSSLANLSKKFKLLGKALPCSTVFDLIAEGKKADGISDSNYEYMDEVGLTFNTFKTVVLPGLKKICAQTWAAEEPYLKLIERLEVWCSKADNDDEHELAFTRMTDWLLYFCAFVLTKPNVTMRKFHKILEEVLGYPDPIMRYNITRVLINEIIFVNQGNVFVENFCYENKVEKGSVKKKAISPHKLIPAVFLAGIAFENEVKETHEVLHLKAQAILSSLPVKYKETHYLKDFISTLQMLSVSKEFSSEQKLLLVEKVLSQNAENFYDETVIDKKISQFVAKGAPGKIEINKFKHRVQAEALNVAAAMALGKQKSAWLLIQGLKMLGDLGRLMGKSSAEFDVVMQDMFKEYFKVNDQKFGLYNSTFSELRNEAALYTYLGKIRSLPLEERASVEFVFSQFIQSVLSKNSEEFYALRYGEASSVHINTIFNGREDLLSAWSQGERCNLQTFIAENKTEAKPVEIDYKVFLFEKIFLHNHLEVRHYELLKKYLLAKESQEILKIKNELQNVLSNSAHAGFSHEQNKPLDYIQLQLHMIEWVEKDSVAVNTQEEFKQKTQALLILIKKIHNLLEKVDRGAEFRSDLSMIEKALKRSIAKPITRDMSQWTIVDTDHFWTCFMIGTDVDGSCQNVSGSSHLNKCLLAYVMDGKNRMLAIQDEMGETIGRCILRILWDVTSKKPVLFMEEIYPVVLTPQFCSVLTLFACQRAEALGLTLICARSTENSYPYPNPVESLGSPAPWEYVDAEHGAKKEGVFKISSQHVHVMYSPFEEKLKDVLQQFLFAKAKDGIKIVGEYLATHDETYDNGTEARVAFTPYRRSIQLSTEKRERCEELEVKESAEKEIVVRLHVQGKKKE